MRRESTVADHRARILRAVVEIERDLDRDVSLDEMAEQACLSRFHFHRVFAGLMGEGPAEYTRRLRLERAAHGLVTTSDRIVTIGKRAGYAKPESFTRAFMARFGVTPSAFRAEHAPRWADRVPSDEKAKGRIEAVPELPVAFIRYVGPYENVVPQFDRLRQWGQARAGRAPKGRDPLLIGIAHDIPGVTPPDQLRFDCGMEVEPGCRPEGEVGVRRAFGGVYAIALHQGTFATLAESYARLAREFVPSQKAVLAGGPAIEIYLTPPERTMTEPGLTEILMGVRIASHTGPARESRFDSGMMKDH
jgi:AraC family transcriptional regulator